MLSGSGTDSQLECFSLAVPGRSNCQAKFNNILTEPGDGLLPVLLRTRSKRYAAPLLYLVADWPVVPHTRSGRLKFQWILLAINTAGTDSMCQAEGPFTQHSGCGTDRFLGLGTIQGLRRDLEKHSFYWNIQFEIWLWLFEWPRRWRTFWMVLRLSSFQLWRRTPLYFWFMGTHLLLWPPALIHF